jgi:hypothetical protein
VTVRLRILAAALVCVLHLALFVPTIGDPSSVLDNDFALQAIAIENGDRPYDDQALEYPPLSIPVLVGPVLLGDGPESFDKAFQWEMIGFDLAIVLVLALALPGRPPRVLSALTVYTVGVFALSGVVLDDSLIDTAPLALARFDLVPALLVLAAVLARDAGRSATWSALLSAGGAVKAFPLLLYPALLRGERNPWRVAIAAAIPVLVCVAILIAWGDEFGAAITYHTGRALQVEALAATPFELASLAGANVTSQVGHGGFEIVASGADFARWLSVVIGFAGYVIVLRAGWRKPVAHLRLATALLAITTVFAPVLSPQFLLWLLPVSAAAYGLGRENLILLVAIVFTQLILQYYNQVDALDGGFVWRVAARNIYLLVYLWLVCAPIVRGVAPSLEDDAEQRVRPDRGDRETATPAGAPPAPAKW